jgi:ribosome maturation protein SDO1
LTVSIEKAVIARLHHSGKKFEVLINPNKALELKKGGKVDMDDVLAYPAVYRDARNTDTIPQNELQEAFGTTDINKIADKIIREGELQMTTEQRREMVEKKKLQIAEIISKRGINPQTNAPHPTQRIIGVMDKVGVSVDPFLDAEMQIEKVLKAIKAIIPISLQKITIQLKIPAQFAGKSYTVLKSYGKSVSEQWTNDGGLQITLQILAGIQEELFQKVSSLTHGQFESKIIKREDYG